MAIAAIEFMLAIIYINHILQNPYSCFYKYKIGANEEHIAKQCLISEISGDSFCKLDDNIPFKVDEFKYICTKKKIDLEN